MRFRYLRILWTVFCGIACVLLIALWARSYSHNEVLQMHTTSRLLLLHARRGRLAYWNRVPYRNPQASRFLAEDMDDILQGSSPGTWGFGRVRVFPDSIVFAPYWFPVLVSAALSTAPLFPWRSRFSLRTLLIATTLVAVVLGLIVWLR
jgi:hypothetical protein